VPALTLQRRPRRRRRRRRRVPGGKGDDGSADDVGRPLGRRVLHRGHGRPADRKVWAVSGWRQRWRRPGVGAAPVGDVARQRRCRRAPLAVGECMPAARADVGSRRPWRKGGGRAALLGKGGVRPLHARLWAAAGGGGGVGAGCSCDSWGRACSRRNAAAATTIVPAGEMRGRYVASSHTPVAAAAGLAEEAHAAVACFSSALADAATGATAAARRGVADTVAVAAVVATSGPPPPPPS